MKEYAEVGKGFGLKDAELQTFVMSQVKAAQEAARLEREATQNAARNERAAERNRREAELEYLARKLELENKAAAERLEIEKKATSEKIDIQKIAESEKRDQENRAAADRMEIERRSAAERLAQENRATADRLEMEGRAAAETLRLQLELESAKLRRLEAGRDGSSSSSDGEEEVRPRSTQAPRPRMPHYVEGKDDIDAYLQRFERFAELCKWEKDDWALHLSTLLSGKALEVYARLPVE